MKVVRGAPPLYREEIAKLNLSSARARRALNSGFPVAVDSTWDQNRNARVYTVYTPYAEKSSMTLMGTDLPRRISNICPVIQDETLMHGEPSTPSELLGQFFIDPSRAVSYANKRGIQPYEYADQVTTDLESPTRGFIGDNHTPDRPSNFDCIRRADNAVFSHDVPTPHIGEGGADAVILTGDLAHLWQWSRMARMPLQQSMEEVFCDIIGANEKGSFEERIKSSKKRIRDVPFFHVTDVTRNGVDFTNVTRNAVLTTKSIPCILNDAFLKQINAAMRAVYSVKEGPIIPLSIFHEISNDHRNGLVDGQVAKLLKLVEGNHRDLNNVLKIAREFKQRLTDSVSYHRHLACPICGKDLTSLFSIHQEVMAGKPHLRHCQTDIQNVGKFVTIKDKSIRRTYSLDCCRQVRRACKGLPQYDKEENRIGLLTEDQAKCIYERPCVIADYLQPLMLPDIGNQRGKYDNMSTTVYLLIPFDRQATLEYLRAEGVENPQVELLTLHNVVECVMPLYSNTEGLVEYRFEALAFRGKLTISVQAYGSTPTGRIPLFDPEATTKRLCLEMLGKDGRVKLHDYQHQLEYNKKRYLKTQGTMFTITNFKRYKSSERGDALPVQERTNWDEYGYTLVGAMAANLIRCASYAGQPLMSPNRLNFGIVSDTRQQAQTTEGCVRVRSDKRKRKRSEVPTDPEWEQREESNELKRALGEERQRTTQLTEELRRVNILLEYYQLCSNLDKAENERLIKANEAVARDYAALKSAREEEREELEAKVTALNSQLQELRQRKKAKRVKIDKTREFLQDGRVLSWLPGCGASVIAV